MIRLTFERLVIQMLLPFFPINDFALMHINSFTKNTEVKENSVTTKETRTARNIGH